MKKKSISLLFLMFLFSCEEDPIFGLERGWLRNDNKENEQNVGNNNDGDNNDNGNDTTSTDYTITLILPNGGESWQAGDIQKIQWESNVPQNLSVGIQLYKDSNYHSNISSQTSNSGEHFWSLPNTLASDDNFMIRVYLTDYPQIEDLSNNYFTINSNTNYLYEDFADLSDWIMESEGWINAGQVYSIPSECEIGDCAWYYLNAYNPGPAIIKRLVNVAVGQTLVMYTYGGYGADVEVYLGDILIGTISSWDGAGQISYTIPNTGSFYLRIVGGGPLQAVGYIDELYIQ